MYRRRREALARHQLHDVAELGRDALQELAPRRHRREELADGDRRALRRSGLAHVDDRAAFGANGGRDVRTARPRHELDRRDRGDARQRLAAEAEGRDACQIGGVADLARRVAGERENGVASTHALAVVAHPDRAQAAFLELDDDAPRAGVERVLEELFHDRRRPLDDLAGRDLDRERLRQHANASGAARLCRGELRRHSAAPCVRPSAAPRRAVPRRRRVRRGHRRAVSLRRGLAA